MWGFGLSGSDQWSYMDNAKKVETSIFSGKPIYTFYNWLNLLF